jgi:hypothetical protein
VRDRDRNRERAKDRGAKENGRETALRGERKIEREERLK